MRAVGLAGYAHSVQAPSLLKNARYQYYRALQSTNAALKDPVDVKKDTTLLSIMIPIKIKHGIATNIKFSAEKPHILGMKLKKCIGLKTPNKIPNTPKVTATPPSIKPTAVPTNGPTQHSERC